MEYDKEILLNRIIYEEFQEADNEITKVRPSFGF